MSKAYYAIRCSDNGEVYSERIEKATGPRTACLLLYGVIYDRPTDTDVKYLNCGSTKSQVQKRIRDSKPEDWKPIPGVNAKADEKLEKIRAVNWQQAMERVEAQKVENAPITHPCA